VSACEGDAVCVNRDVLSIQSPARSVRALRFVRSCGPGAEVTTHVSVLQVGESLGDDPGNAFIVDGRPDLTLLWIAGKQLAISGAGDAAPRLQKNLVNGVRISYEDRKH
jgi:hypothetical protein